MSLILSSGRTSEDGEQQGDEVRERDTYWAKEKGVGQRRMAVGREGNKQK